GRRLQRAVRRRAGAGRTEAAGAAHELRARRADAGRSVQPVHRPGDASRGEVGLHAQAGQEDDGDVGEVPDVRTADSGNGAPLWREAGFLHGRGGGGGVKNGKCKKVNGKWRTSDHASMSSLHLRHLSFTIFRLPWSEPTPS